MSKKEFKQKVDMTTGSIPKHLVKFAIPMFLSNVLSSMYTLTDRIWIGRLLGTSGLAAVSASMPIFFLLPSLIGGFTMSSTILISQFLGANDEENLKKTINTTYATLFLVVVIITGIGLASSSALLKLINTPPEAFDDALAYLNIMFGGLIFMFTYYIFGAIMRGLGDSKTPMYFVLITAIVNMVLDPMLIAGYWIFPELGIEGAAIATIFSQALSALLCFLYLRMSSHIVEIKLSALKIHRDILAKIFKLGLPTAFQQSAMSLSGLFLMGLVNSYGVVFAAGMAVAWQIEGFIVMPAMSMGGAVATFSGQNTGAGMFNRILKSYKWGVLFIWVVLAVFISLCMIFAPQIAGIFSDNPDVVATAVDYIRLVALSYFIFSVATIGNNIINGAGGTKFTMISTMVQTYVFRIPLAYLFARVLGMGGRGVYYAVLFTPWFGMIMALYYVISGKYKRHSMVTPKDDNVEIIEKT